MPKWAKMIIAILLLPACVGAGQALKWVVQRSGGADLTWVPFLAGAVCWLVILMLLPKPMWVYVFGHELTHVVWVWLFGGSVKRFKASSKGGYVVVTKSNFLITLAPYFFPLYAVLVVAVFVAGNGIWGWQDYLAGFHLFLGAAYAFHITLTLHVLRTRQSDITSEGYLFSAVVIYLGNVSVLIIGIPLLVAQVKVMTALNWWLFATWDLLRAMASLCRL